MRANMIRISKGVGAALLLATLAACGSGLDSSTGSSTSTSGSGGGGSNNTPPGVPNNIVFITPASTNTVIALQGTGGNTNAEVTFEVDDASSTGVAGIPVTFSLIPTTGDASLTTATGTTDTNGRVSTFVVSGNVHGSVTVHAVISTPSGTKTADSNALTITTGIPTENNFSVAAANPTVNNGDDTQNVADVITVQLSDRFHNPAPDGTAVAFTANSGQIPGQCVTVGGGCSVTWESSGLPNPSDGNHLQGRAEILAYTVGEESFDDVDNDGVFDNNDAFTTATSGVTIDAFTESSNPSVDDIGEVFLDYTERSLSLNPAINTAAYKTPDFYIDFNKDGVRNGPDGKFYGFGCKGTATVPCGNTATKEIAKQICIEISTSDALVGSSNGIPGGATGSGSFTTPNTYSVGAGPAYLTFTVSDKNGQGLASGSTVTFLQAGVTSAVTITTPTNLPFTYQNSGCGPNVQSFTLTVTPVSPAPVGVLVGGSLQLKVVTPTPGGAETDSIVITLTP